MSSSESRQSLRVSIALPQEVHQRLVERCVREGLTLSELANALLEQALFQHNLDLDNDGHIGSGEGLPWAPGDGSDATT